MREGPDRDAGFGLFEMPAPGLLGPVMFAAEWTRAVVRHYNPSVNDNRNGWGFWQIDNGGGPRLWLQSIRPAKAG